MKLIGILNGTLEYIDQPQTSLLLFQLMQLHFVKNSILD